MLNALKKILNNLTPSERRVADFILQNPTEVSYLTIAHLSDKVKVSTATIMRLSAKLGLSGYKELQDELQKFLKTDNAPKSRLLSNLALSDDAMWATTLNLFANQINNLATAMDKQSLNLAVQTLSGDQKILITAVRSGLPVGIFLAQNLKRLRGNTHFIQADLGESIDDVVSLEQNDVLVAVSFPRYAQRIYELTKVAKQRKAKIIVITDSYTAPLVDNGDVVLICDAKSLSFHNSPIMAMIVAEYIIGAVAKKHAKQANTHLEDVEEILHRIGYHAKTH